MSELKERAANAVGMMSDEQKESALQFLIGYNLPVAVIILRWTLETYPELCTSGVEI